jgi:hypothetical protein
MLLILEGQVLGPLALYDEPCYGSASRFPFIATGAHNRPIQHKRWSGDAAAKRPAAAHALRRYRRKACDIAEEMVKEKTNWGKARKARLFDIRDRNAHEGGTLMPRTSERRRKGRGSGGGNPRKVPKEQRVMSGIATELAWQRQALVLASSRLLSHLSCPCGRIFFTEWHVTIVFLQF